MHANDVGRDHEAKQNAHASEVVPLVVFFPTFQVSVMLLVLLGVGYDGPQWVFMFLLVGTDASPISLADCEPFPLASISTKCFDGDMVSPVSMVAWVSEQVPGEVTYASNNQRTQAGYYLTLKRTESIFDAGVNNFNSARTVSTLPGVVVCVYFVTFPGEPYGQG